MDLILTSCVGDNDDTSLDARVILQAGHYASSVYTDARLEVVREKSTGLKYVGAYGDLFAVENKIQFTEISVCQVGLESFSLRAREVRVDSECCFLSGDEV